MNYHFRRLVGYWVVGSLFYLFTFKAMIPRKKKKILVDVAAFTRKVMCGDIENHGYLFVSMGKKVVYWSASRKQCFPLSPRF